MPSILYIQKGFGGYHSPDWLLKTEDSEGHRSTYITIKGGTEAEVRTMVAALNATRSTPSPIEHAVTAALTPPARLVLRRGNAETQVEGFVTVELSRDDAGIRAVTVGDDSSPAGVEVELTPHELRQAERVLGEVSLKGGEP